MEVEIRAIIEGIIVVFIMGYFRFWISSEFKDVKDELNKTVSNETCNERRAVYIKDAQGFIADVDALQASLKDTISATTCASKIESCSGGICRKVEGLEKVVDGNLNRHISEIDDLWKSVRNHGHRGLETEDDNKVVVERL